MKFKRGQLYDLNGDLVRYKKCIKSSPFGGRFSVRCLISNRASTHGWALFEILAADLLSTTTDWIRVRKTNSTYYRNLYYSKSTDCKPLDKKSILLYVSRKIKSDSFINLLKGARK